MITMGVLACRVAVTFVYYQNIPELIWFKELLMILIAVLMIIDIIKYRPFTNDFMYKAYISGVMTFGVCMVLFTIFLETNFIPEYELAYYMINLSVVFSAAVIGH
jgi:hypothetical protein